MNLNHGTPLQRLSSYQQMLEQLFPNQQKSGASLDII